jgi:hypothetical protein
VIARVPGLRQLPQAAGAVLDDTVLFDSWRGVPLAHASSLISAR